MNIEVFNKVMASNIFAIAEEYRTLSNDKDVKKMSDKVASMQSGYNSKTSFGHYFLKYLILFFISLLGYWCSTKLLNFVIKDVNIYSISCKILFYAILIFVILRLIKDYSNRKTYVAGDSYQLIKVKKELNDLVKEKYSERYNIKNIQEFEKRKQSDYDELCKSYKKVYDSFEFETNIIYESEGSFLYREKETNDLIFLSHKHMSLQGFFDILDKYIGKEDKTKIYGEYWDALVNKKTIKYDDVVYYSVKGDVSYRSEVIQDDVNIGGAVLGYALMGTGGAILGGQGKIHSNTIKDDNRYVELKTKNNLVHFNYNAYSLFHKLYPEKDYETLLVDNGMKTAKNLEKIANQEKKLEKITNKENNNSTTDNIQQLREYKKLFDEGVITEEEFKNKKKELL